MTPDIRLLDFAKLPGGRRCLGTEEIHIWKVPVGSASLSVPDQQILSAPELRILQSFSSDARRASYILGHSALHQILSAYGNIAPEEIILEKDSRGKLFPAQSPGSLSRLHFNLSHSGEWIVIAVSESFLVGIDTERIRPVKYQEKILKKICHPAELKLYRTAAPQARRYLFYRLWTAKEAVLKGIGQGFYQPGNSFCIPLDISAPDSHISVESPESSLQGWIVSEIPLAEGYACSLACHRAGL